MTAVRGGSAPPKDHYNLCRCDLSRIRPGGEDLATRELGCPAESRDASETLGRPTGNSKHNTKVPMTMSVITTVAWSADDEMTPSAWPTPKTGTATIRRVGPVPLLFSAPSQPRRPASPETNGRQREETGQRAGERMGNVEFRIGEERICLWWASVWKSRSATGNAPLGGSYGSSYGRAPLMDVCHRMGERCPHPFLWKYDAM